MTGMSRRQFAIGALGLIGSRSLFAAKPMVTTIGGVTVGTILYSFREVPRAGEEDFLETGIRACRELGIGVAELWSTMVQPPQPLLTRSGQYVLDPENAEMMRAREEIRRWRIQTPLSYWEAVRKRFDDAGITLVGYSVTLADDFTDDEIDSTLRAVRAMGIRHLGTNQTRVAMGRRVVPFAEQHGVILSFHNHANVKDPNEIATVASMDEVLAMSPNYKINLDIGHFVAANQDPIAFIRSHHEHIAYLHLKDRKRDDGPNMSWGQGDTPIREVLRLVASERYPISCLIEYEYRSEQSALVEVQRCLDYISAALT